MQELTELITERVVDEDGLKPSMQRPAMVRTAGRENVTDADKQHLINGLRAGRSLAALLRDDLDLPGAAAIALARMADPFFDAGMEQARADGMTAMIDEALDYQHSVRGHKDQSTAAAKYADTVIKASEKLAPKRFGAMLKLAGHDGEKLTVSVVQYAQPKAIEAVFSKVESHAALESNSTATPDKPSGK